MTRWATVHRVVEVDAGAGHDAGAAGHVEDALARSDAGQVERARRLLGEASVRWEAPVG